MEREQDQQTQRQWKDKAARQGVARTESDAQGTVGTVALKVQDGKLRV